MPDHTNAAFAEVVKTLIAGRSLRELSRTTGISHTRISDMAFGVVPTFKLLQRFAAGMELSEETQRQLFEAAGYTPPSLAPTGPNPSEALIDGWALLCEEYPQYLIAFPVPNGGARSLTHREVESILRTARERAERGGYPLREKNGEGEG